jgi:hypothetical protein
VTTDDARKYYLVTNSKSWRPMFFGAVVMFPRYAGDHLMPLSAFLSWQEASPPV